jgi:metal-dependent amidase/aminoacylase/carboxypeptidase family protein
MIDIQTSASGNDSNTGNHSADEYISLISEYIDSTSKSLRQLSLKIHDSPELRYKEFIAHEAITTFIEAQRDQKWEVTKSAYGIATAFAAVFDSGREGPVVSFNAEYGEF